MKEISISTCVYATLNLFRKNNPISFIEIVLNLRQHSLDRGKTPLFHRTTYNQNNNQSHNVIKTKLFVYRLCQLTRKT